MFGDSATPVPAAVFDSAKGSEFHAFLASNGKLSDLEAVNVSEATARVQGFLTDFFPWVKKGTKKGEQWADTSSKTTTDGTDSVVIKRITAYRVVDTETRATPRRRCASRASTSPRWRAPSRRRTGPRASKARARGTGRYFVSSDGVYLGGDWQLQSVLTIAGSFSNEPLPITITQTTKVTTLP